jgi:uncharacterized protein (TIGR03435 family)
VKRQISILAIATALLAQDTPQRKLMPADANPAFEVATIKPSPPDARGGGSGVSPSGRFTAHNISLRGLILFAWALHPRQLEGGPPWIDSDRFDIAAQPDSEGSPNKRQLTSMLQRFLADRFQLRFHREKRDLASYAITVAKQGAKLTVSEGDPSGLPTATTGFGHVAARNMNMEEFAEGLQGMVLDRPVVDRTGIPGRFDFTLNWAPDEFQFLDRPGNAPPPAVDPASPGLFKAIEDQLGLKLESTKAAFDILVIEHVEKPSEN